MTGGKWRHCDRCRFSWKVFAGDTFVRRPPECCPMPNACRTCDEWEMEHDETLILPRAERSKAPRTSVRDDDDAF